MRLCRIKLNGQVQLAFYDEQRIVPLTTATKAFADKMGRKLDLPASESLLDFLPPAGRGFTAAKELAAWMTEHPAVIGSAGSISTSSAELLVPIPRPNKIFLLAGNYTEHIKEGGGVAPERAETFPYVFMKPPTTTLTDPNKPVRIPKVSPGAIDWELELGVIIGKTVKGISEADALSCVAGYTVINDISNRKFRPNPDRKKRDKDAFFDWLHGKWHDSFCPAGPCVTSADAIPDPQTLKLELKLNGEVRQNSTTAAMIFPVAALIEFVAAICTLEPGDIISTGTPAGVGSATGTFLKPGDVLQASIGSIGTLVSPVVAE
jgi:2-keto-4-pentenoate hydratase/2-oxohepta-3-ene-1,7-dioic acid hydratase in catechol pathway